MARPNKPRHRAGKGTWYATVDGKHVGLPIGLDGQMRAAWADTISPLGDAEGQRVPVPAVAGRGPAV